VFKVSFLLVDEGITSNPKCVLVSFLAFPVTCTPRPPTSTRWVPLGNYGLVTVGPLSTRPLSPLVLSDPSLATADANKNLDDVTRILAR
jgi:hypothetical protein